VYSVFDQETGDPEVLDLGACRRLLDQHMTGADDASPQLWAAITLQTWLASNRPVVPRTTGTHDNASAMAGSRYRVSGE